MQSASKIIAASTSMLLDIQYLLHRLLVYDTK
jgi:hypothetical protein